MKLFIENNIERAAITSSGALANYPVINIRHPSPSTVCRLDDGESAYVDIDMSAYPSKQYCTGIAIIGHNLTAAGSFNLKNGTTQGASDVLDEDFDAHEAVWGWGEFPWANWIGWGGYMTPDMITDYFPYIIRTFYFPQGAAGAWWRLTATEPAASSLTYIELGTVMLTEVYEPIYNMNWGFKMTPIQLSKLSEMSGGNTFVDLGDKKRKFSFNFKRIQSSEVYWKNQRAAYIMGNTKPMCADFFPDETDVSKRLNNRCYGYLKETPGISYPGLNIVENSSEFSIEDEL